MMLLRFLLSSLLVTFSIISNAQDWTEISKKTPPNYLTNMGYQYGEKTAISGDYAVVSAKGFDQNKGIAYVLFYDGSNWTNIAELSADDQEVDDFFATSVGISENTIVIGAYNKETNDKLGCVYVFTKTTNEWVDMTQTAKLTADDGSPTDYFGSSVSISGDYVVVGAYKSDTEAEYYTYKNTGSAYIFKKATNGWDNMTQTAKLAASDGYDDDNFGFSVSISGDNVVVGAFNDDDNGSASGSAYLFTKTDTGWSDMTEKAKLTPNDGEEDDNFGGSVSISGDDVVVGAYNHDGTGEEFNSDKGAAYVFTKGNGGWNNMTQTAKLTASDAQNFDSFGYTVSISGNNIVVGAYGQDAAVSKSGAAYVFSKTSDEWNNMTQAAKVIPEDDVLAYSTFGASVSISGDNIIVGSYLNEYSNAGAVYTYTKPTDGWGSTISLIDKLTPDILYGQEKNRFGYSTAVDGNYAVIGAPNSLNGTGFAFVWFYNGENWINQGKLSASDGSEDDFFGGSVSISEDNIVVGAVGDDNDGFTSSGSAYIFVKPADGWRSMTQTAKIRASNESDGDRFGGAVSISGDNIVVGAKSDDTDANGVNSGSAFVFTKPSTGWSNMTQTAQLTAGDGHAYEEFGNSVCISGINIIVGAEDHYAFQYIRSGAAYIFTKPQEGWGDMTHTAKLLASDTKKGHLFGASVGISGDDVVVGAWQDSQRGARAGAAYVFTKPFDGWVDTIQTAKLTAGDGTYYDHFGYSVAISANNVVVGANHYKSTSTGAAYVFEKPDSGWANMIHTTKLNASGLEGDDHFGKSVSISADNILIGAPGDKEIIDESGATYMFRKECAPFDLSIINNSGGLTINESRASLKWLDCSDNYAVLLSDTSKSFMPLNSGSYAVEVSNGSCVDTSLCEQVLITGGDYMLSQERIKVYPNPNIGVITIEVSKLPISNPIQIINTLGEVVQKIDINQLVSTIHLKLKSGIYFLILGKTSTKIVINQ